MSNENHDTRANMKTRVVMSFLVFCLLVLLSVAICAQQVAVNPAVIRDEFLGYEFVSGYNERVNNYVDDVCALNGISSDGINDIIDYDFSYTVVEQYVGGILGNDKGYIETTAKNTLEDAKEEIIKQIKLAVEATDYKYSKSAAAELADSITDYMLSQLDNMKLGTVKSVTNVGKIASKAAIAVLGVCIAVVCLITYFIGVKRYRSVRAIACGFLSAGWLDILLTIMVVIISKIKTVDIFPLYLRDTFMSYFGMCVQTLVVIGVVLITLAYVIATVVWLQKKSLK